MNTVVTFRNELLPISETFIEAQVRALKSFRARYVGLVPAQRSLPLPADTIFLCGRRSPISKLLAASYKFGAFPRHMHSTVRAAGARLVHAHFALDGATALPLLSYLQIPMIVTLHGYDVTTRDRAFCQTIGGSIYLANRSRLWAKTSLFICVSEFIRKKALEAGFPREKLIVHYQGIDQSLFQSAKEEVDRKSVLFVARLVEKKGCSYLLDAMAEVQGCYPQANLIVVGEGPEFSILTKQADKLRLNCKFMGAQPQVVIRQLLQSARVFCVPSVAASNGDSEGLGMVFAEAQAMGVPVVSFHHGGIPEVVRHGQTGLLAPERDTVLLAKYLKRLIADDCLWTEYSCAGIAWAKQRFTLTKQTCDLEQLYRNVSGMDR
jgi:colanic acid/amylovoran biosynthesis glycosyltransferase